MRSLLIWRACRSPQLKSKQTMGHHSNKRLLVLKSSIGSHREQVQNQNRAETLLKARKINYETVDGADPSLKDVRNELFAISGLRGIYPQFFMIDHLNIRFLGDFETLETMNDASALPSEILDKNPQILTWDRLLGHVGA